MPAIRGKDRFLPAVFSFFPLFLFKIKSPSSRSTAKVAAHFRAPPRLSRLKNRFFRGKNKFFLLTSGIPFAPIFCLSHLGRRPMLIFYDPQCAEYGSSMRPEQPARVLRTSAHLKAKRPAWEFRVPPAAPAVTDAALLSVHTPAHVKRLAQPRDFDADTPFFPGIGGHARRAVGSAFAAARHALEQRTPVFSLMRPPGHHAVSSQAMGFCYLNQIALAAVHAACGFDVTAPPKRRVAVWDFDAHHGNGTEAILESHAAASHLFFASVHQYPGYPGTGTNDRGPRIRNWPVAPHTPRAQHMAALRASLDAVLAFQPELILVSAGFDAYARDPITSMTLEQEDFATLGRWLGEIRIQKGISAAAILEGGYSDDLPLLVEAFLAAWENAGEPSVPPS
jgi:acetoin utilization deacetylase AcuC-like enzyme